MDKSVIARVVTVAAGRFAPGHLGELTQQVPFEMVGAVPEQTCRVQQRIRDLPAPVVVYLLLAGCLFAELGYAQVWRRLAAGLGGLGAAAPTASAMAQARRRLGPGPLRELFALLRGPDPSGTRWRGLLVCAVDGTVMSVADSAANLAVYGRDRRPRHRPSRDDRQARPGQPDACQAAPRHPPRRQARHVQVQRQRQSRPHHLPGHHRHRHPRLATLDTKRRALTNRPWANPTPEATRRAGVSPFRSAKENEWGLMAARPSGKSRVNRASQTCMPSSRNRSGWSRITR